MSEQPHKVWKVVIGSLDDERLKDRSYFQNRRHFAICNLLKRAEYYIEAKGQGIRAEKKALQLAIEDGISRPVVMGIEWANFSRQRKPNDR